MYNVENQPGTVNIQIVATDGDATMLVDGKVVCTFSCEYSVPYEVNEKIEGLVCKHPSPAEDIEDA